MSRHTRLLLTILTVAVTLLAAAATSATAGKLSIQLTQRFRAVWEQLEFSNTVNESIVRCQVTLEGSLHSGTIRKVQRSLIGYISRAAINTAGCIAGRVTILQETLPWHVRYDGFTGTLPSIATLILQFVGATYLINAAFNICRAVTSTLNPARVILPVRETLKIIGNRADETAQIPLTNGPGGSFCELARGRLSGEGSFAALGTGVQLSIKLI